MQANLEKEVEREKALAEAEGRIKENRENEDVNRRAMQLRLEEERKKLVEAINTTFTNLGSGTLAILTDKEKLGTALAGLTVLALGVYSAREGTRVAGQVFSRYHAVCCCCVKSMMQVSFAECTIHSTASELYALLHGSGTTQGAWWMCYIVHLRAIVVIWPFCKACGATGPVEHGNLFTVGHEGAQ